MTLACEDAKSKLVDVVTVAEELVGISLVENLKFGQDVKAKFLFRL